MRMVRAWFLVCGRALLFLCRPAPHPARLLSLSLSSRRPTLSRPHHPAHTHPPHTGLPPVVALHGFDSSCLEFRRLLPRLGEAGVPAYAVDLVGWGFTDHAPFVGVGGAALGPAQKREHLYAFWKAKVRERRRKGGGGGWGGARPRRHGTGTHTQAHTRICSSSPALPLSLTLSPSLVSLSLVGAPGSRSAAP